MLKKSRKAVTLAIGDGANDVSMIKGKMQNCHTLGEMEIARCIYVNFQIMSRWH